MPLVIFQIHWQQKQLQDHRPKTSTKISKKTQPKPFPSTANGWRKGTSALEPCPASQQHSLHGRKECEQWT